VFHPWLKQSNVNAKKSFRIVATDHSGTTVFKSRTFARILAQCAGLELSHTAHQKGELAREITGVQGAEIKLAVLKTLRGHN
jgi:hypothetical protein